jgi:hypothetical protein
MRSLASGTPACGLRPTCDRVVCGVARPGAGKSLLIDFVAQMTPERTETVGGPFRIVSACHTKRRQRQFEEEMVPDAAPHGPDSMFSNEQVDGLVAVSRSGIARCRRAQSHSGQGHRDSAR